jgi:uncharacterized BrkB/YihY/UPF0761 family membrane protein
MNYDIALILSIFPLIIIIVVILSPSNDSQKQSTFDKKPLYPKTKKLTDD